MQQISRSSRRAFVSLSGCVAAAAIAANAGTPVLAQSKFVITVVKIGGSLAPRQNVFVSPTQWVLRVREHPPAAYACDDAAQ